MGLASSQAEPSSFAWRWPIAFQGVFLIFILTALPILPESPRWLAQQDRLEAAADVFARLEGKGVSIEHQSVTRQLDEVKASLQQELLLGSTSWAEVFTEGENRNISRVLLGAGPYMYVPPFHSVARWEAEIACQDESVVWHQFTGLLLAHYFRAQYRSIYAAFTRHLRSTRNPVFYYFLAVSSYLPWEFSNYH